MILRKFSYKKETFRHFIMVIRFDFFLNIITKQKTKKNREEKVKQKIIWLYYLIANVRPLQKVSSLRILYFCEAYFVENKNNIFFQKKKIKSFVFGIIYCNRIFFYCKIKKSVLLNAIFEAIINFKFYAITSVLFCSCFIFLHQKLK